MNPEWLWASWSNCRGRIAVTSEIQAKLVTALFNSLKVAGVPHFRAWRDHEVEELTSVRLTLSGGFLFTWPVDKIIQKLLSWNDLLGTYSEPSQGQPTVSHHVVHFKVDKILKSNLAKHQKGSGTFFLPLVGQDREIHMARDHQVVAAEAAAGLKVRIETALAKAIAASRPDLGPGAAPPATTDGQNQQQQQGNEITKKVSIQSPNPDTYSNLGQGSVSPPMPEPETEFVKLQRQLLQELPEQQGEEPQVTLETAQQPGAPEHVPQPAAHLSALEIWEQQQHHRHPLPTLQPGAQEPSIALALRQANEKEELAKKHQQQQQLQHQGHPLRESELARGLRLVGEKRQLALQQQQQQQRQQHLEQQQHQQLGKITTGIPINLNHKPNPNSLLGLFASTAVRGHIEATVSPPRGTDMATLQSGLPPVNHDLSTSDSDSSEASQTMANNSTGSGKVDDVNINLDEEDMSEGKTNELLNPEVKDDDEMAVEDSWPPQLLLLCTLPPTTTATTIASTSFHSSGSNKNFQTYYVAIAILKSVISTRTAVNSVEIAPSHYRSYNCKPVTSSASSQPQKNSLKPYDDFTVSKPISKCFKTKQKISNFSRKLLKSLKKISLNSKKSNFQIRTQNQNRSIRKEVINDLPNHQRKVSKFKTRELPSGSVYFLTIFREQIFFKKMQRGGFQSCFSPS
jgi:hypothetical protein